MMLAASSLVKLLMKYVGSYIEFLCQPQLLQYFIIGALKIGFHMIEVFVKAD